MKNWLEAVTWREGVFAIGIHNPDHGVITKSRVKAFSTQAVENALKNAGSLFQNLERTHLNFGRTCLVYKNALIHAERRLDGFCLVIFTTRDDKAYDADGVDKVFTEFRTLTNDGRAV